MVNDVVVVCCHRFARAGGILLAAGRRDETRTVVFDLDISPYGDLVDEWARCCAW